MDLSSVLKTIQELASSNQELAYILLGVCAFVENLFPPIPGDTVTIFGAFLVGTGDLNFGLVLISTSLGSLLGFMSLFYIGYHFGRDFLIKKNWKFFSIEKINKTNAWFDKYGYKVILANRFLSGIRSFISLSSGISKMNPKSVAILAFISCIIWNGILLYLGYLAGDNWQVIDQKIKQYSLIVSSIIIITILILIYRWWRRRRT